MKWILSKLFPYNLPSRLGVMLVAQSMVTDYPRSALE